MEHRPTCGQVWVMRENMYKRAEETRWRLVSRPCFQHRRVKCLVLILIDVSLHSQLAIVSSSKHFLSLPLVQHLINQIYLGHLIYSPTSSRSLIRDYYVSERTRLRGRNSHSSLHATAANGSPINAQNPEYEGRTEVYLYNPYEAGWLDHQRLRVPKWRVWLEFMSFTILIALFVTTITCKPSYFTECKQADDALVRDLKRLTIIEVVFIVFTFGFMLEEVAASKEHGWTSAYSLRCPPTLA